MTASYLPTILVPLVGLVFPAIAMASIFVYIEKQEIN
jgi:photosystem I subunit 8